MHKNLDNNSHRFMFNGLLHKSKLLRRVYIVIFFKCDHKYRLWTLNKKAVLLNGANLVKIWLAAVLFLVETVPLIWSDVCLTEIAARKLVILHGAELVSVGAESDVSSRVLLSAQIPEDSSNLPPVSQDVFSQYGASDGFVQRWRVDPILVPFIEIYCVSAVLILELT